MTISRKHRQIIMLLAFTFPALLFYSVFMLAPTIGGLWYSLTDWDILNKSHNFIGLSNFKEALFEDSNFTKSLLFTLKYVVFMVVLENVIALLLAVLVESRKKSKGIFRTIFFAPNMISMIIAGFMWMFIFTRVIPYIASNKLFSFLDRSWIGDPTFSFYAILLVSLWGGVGYLMIIYIAGLQSVPDQIKEATAIDGANAFQTFWHITLPMILPSITINLFITLNSSFKVFDIVYSLTGGGPGRHTEVVALNIYNEAFSMNNRYGYASAKAMLLFLIIAVITLIQLLIMKRREVEA